MPKNGCFGDYRVVNFRSEKIGKIFTYLVTRHTDPEMRFHSASVADEGCECEGGRERFVIELLPQLKVKQIEGKHQL